MTTVEKLPELVYFRLLSKDYWKRGRGVYREFMREYDEWRLFAELSEMLRDPSKIDPELLKKAEGKECMLAYAAYILML